MTMAPLYSADTHDVPPGAVIAHSCSRRLRLKIEPRRHHVDYFGAVASSLKHCPGVVTVTVNPTAASVAIMMEKVEPSVILNYAVQHRLFSFTGTDAHPTTVLLDATTQLRKVDDRLRQVSRGTVDLASIFYILLIGLALIQALRGNIAGPTTTLLWNALSLVQLAELAKQINKKTG